VPPPVPATAGWGLVARERGLRRRGEDEPEPRDPGEAAARGGGARGDDGAQDRRGVPGNHGRVRGQLELPAREHHLHSQGACLIRSSMTALAPDLSRNSVDLGRASLLFVVSC
jgi:hypothetical protein